MGAVTIRYKKYKKFVHMGEEGLNEFHSLLNGGLFHPRKLNAIYNTDTLTEFVQEFEEVVLSNLNEEDSVRAYVQEVYYNGVGRLLVQFSDLQAKRLAQLNGDWAVACGDDVFTKITNGYIASLAHVAMKVYNSAQKYKLAELVLPNNIRREDYNITGEYMALFAPLKEVAVELEALNEGIPESSVGEGLVKKKEITFEDFLTVEDEDNKKRLLQYLIDNYTNSKPKEVVFMLYALADLSLIRNSFDTNQSELHRSLQATFGKTGSRQAYNQQFTALNRGTQAGEEEQIERHKRGIQDCVNNNEVAI